ncbi:putative enzyme related to lactoylglutathione lyase [Arthrobacter pigmenti]|uniref:Putative enzyme related to lactoylglutathione lyase n=1 Tax=Arthrobacter pigmenti TaxID=271432 RepID=A0A846RUH7_9MICC|nr:VOC family protein [Arthrobacter pigmenti]NJC23797.1 putative enzyme related to lactoylglutathione lyase [Arthrobacter pigmenti]
MPTRETFPDGVPCWVDLTSSDTAAAADFYGGLLGWGAEDLGPGYGHYTKFLADGLAVGGMIGNSEASGFPDGWVTYFATADVRALTERASLAEAEIMRAKLTVRTIVVQNNKRAAASRRRLKSYEEVTGDPESG